jgi:hypothetical protein
VAISGTTAVVGDYVHANGGAAYVFTKTGAVWKQVAELKGSDTVAPDEFGWSVAVSGTTAVVGAPGVRGALGTGANGRAYVFTKRGATWTQTAELEGSDTTGDDYFGNSVAISATTLVVGAPVYGNYAGAAYVFTETGGAWKQVAALEGVARADAFGFSVAVSGATLVVGAAGASPGGRVYVFTETAGVWRQVADVEWPVDGFDIGYSVAVSGTTAVVGDQGQSNGVAYVVTKTAGVWRQVAELKPPPPPWAPVAPAPRRPSRAQPRWWVQRDPP